MIELEFSTEGYFGREYHVDGGPEGYDIECKHPRCDGFLLRNNNVVTLDMGHDRIVVNGIELKGPNSNGCTSIGKTHEYSCNGVHLELEFGPECYFPWSMVYVKGTINSRVVFLAKSRTASSIRFIGSNIVPAQFQNEESMVAFAYMCIFIMYLRD